MRRQATVLLLGAALTIVGAAPLHAQEASDLRGVQVSPARTEVDRTDRTVDQLVILANEEDRPQQVEVSLTGLGQRLDGTAVFVDDPATTGALRAEGLGTVELPPGARHEVRVTGTFPEGQPATYFAVVATFSPQGGDAGSTVRARVELGSVFLLRGPRPWVETVAVRDAGFLSRSEDGSFTVYADVEDTGNVHVRPSGTVTITAEDGAVLDTVELERQLVLPGYVRRLTGRWTPPDGFAGPVGMTVELRDPDARHEVTLPFPPDLSEDLEIVSLRAARDVDGRPVVEAEVGNTGSGVLDVVGDLTLEDGPAGVRAGPFAAVGAPDLEPGETALLPVLLPEGTAPGPWRAVFTARAGVVERTAEATITFPDEPGTVQEPVAATPILRDRGVLVPVAVGLLVVAVAAVLLVWLLARRRPEPDPGGAPAEDEFEQQLSG